MRSEQAIFDDLASLCASPGYIHALAVICFRENMLILADDVTGDDLSRQLSEQSLTRTETTTLIGLMMRAPINFTLPEPHVLAGYIEQTEKLLQEMHHSIAAPLLAAVASADELDAAGNPFTSAEVLREPIFYGPESAYSFQYRDFAPRKYAKDAAWLLRNKKVDLVIGRDVCIGIDTLLNKRLADTLPGLATTPPTDWTMLPGFTFSCDELAIRINGPVKSVRSIVEAFAMPDGEYNDAFTSLQAFNAAHAYPIIRAGPDDFILLQSYGMSQAIYDTPIYWMWEDDAYASIASRHRGEFAEDLASDRLAHVFGADRVFRNVEIHGSKGDTRGEIDVLVIFGDRAIVAQAKSKKLTLMARKGNDRQLRCDFKAAIQDSVDQALSCAELLGDPSVTLRCKDGTRVALANPLSTIFPLSVIADHYPALAFQARQFLQVRTDERILRPLVIDVFALDAMTEMLESPLRLLSYLSLRDRFDDKLRMNHEHMLLSHHLTQNLWVPDDVGLFALTDDNSADLDIAMAARRDGTPGEKTPDGILTRAEGTPFAKIIAELEDQPEAVAIDLGLMLLELGEDAVRAINKGVDQIRKRTARDGRPHDFTAGFAASSSGLTIHCSQLRSNEAELWLRSHCRMRKYSEKVERWFGVSLRTDGSIQLAVKQTGPWRFDETMEIITADLTRGDRPKSYAQKKIGRNQPCHCGSGKKFKRCCGTRR